MGKNWYVREMGFAAKGWFGLLYRLLGVEKFKRLVLKFERLLHGKNGGRNRNYHPESMTERGLTQYVWYLRCNSLLHVLSIAALVGYDVLLRVLGFHVWPLVLLEVLLLIYNVYCILLQRYNYLKLRRLIEARRDALEKRFERHCRKFDESLGQGFGKGEAAGLGQDWGKAGLHGTIAKAEIDMDLSVLERVEKVFLERESCLVGASDLESLIRFEGLLERAGMRKDADGKAVRPLATALWELEPPAWTDMVLFRVRKAFDKNVRGQKPLAILRTQDGECERLFQRVFGNGPAEMVLLRVRVLRHCYEVLRDAVR